MMSRDAASIRSFPAIIGWGAGGHSKSVIDAVESLDCWKIMGLIDSDASRWGTTWANHAILGGEDKLVSLLADGVRNAFVGVGGVGNNVPRMQVFQRLLDYGYQLPSICHRSSVVSCSAQIGRGSVILAGAIVAAAAMVSENVIINTGAIVDHDCDIGAHSHISTGSRLGGSVHIGEGAHVGIGATIREGLTVGAHAIVGAGSVVIQDVPPGATVVGSPARIIKDNTAPDLGSDSANPSVG
jgi:UDP-perosamine 4-acetyltransferase